MIAFRQYYSNRDLPHNSYKSQYFGNKFFEYTPKGELFVDCGAFDGDTVRNFKKLMRKKCIENFQCVCFEPDPDNFTALKRNHPDAIAFNCGVWNENSVLYFSAENGDASRIVEFKNEEESIPTVKISVKKIDETPECSNATFIKMDIEGSEQNALLGAKTIIQKNKPKLAICIYHSDEDMVKIPKMIHEWVPEYKLYVRHHSNTLAETVLYASV